MGLRTGDEVPLEDLIKGMAVVSGNDACVAVAEYLEGSVEAFVSKMNLKARELGMTNTLFLTPNGLPARGQVTTARDMAKLSIAYLQRFPESLSIHSLCSYTYRHATHHNANRLLGKCPGVDGIKTGFVCASGYNISATAKRDDTRLLAVLMGAPSPGVRARETAKLLDGGYHLLAQGHPEKTRALDAYNSGFGTDSDSDLDSADSDDDVLTTRHEQDAPRHRIARSSRSRVSHARSRISGRKRGGSVHRHVGTHMRADLMSKQNERKLAKTIANSEGTKQRSGRKHTHMSAERSTVTALKSGKAGRRYSEVSPKHPVGSKIAHRTHRSHDDLRPVSKAPEPDKNKNHKKRKHTSNASAGQGRPAQKAHHAIVSNLKRG